MRRRVARAWVAAATGVVLSAVGMVDASAAANRAVGVAPASAATSGTQLWLRRYVGLSGSDNGARAVAASPTGKQVFVTGWSTGTNSYDDYATVAYNAVTGKRLWVQRRSAGYGSTAVAVAVSPGGATVFVTGYDAETSGNDVWATVAYNAATGQQVWIKSYASFGAQPTSVVASPTGKQVFVTGWSTTTYFGAQQYTTIAYNPATGKQLWVRNYSVSSGRASTAAAVAVSPSGSTVYVTGQGIPAGTGYADYATLAYSAATGTPLWSALYPTGGEAGAVSIAATGTQVFVTGSDNTGTYFKYGTLAYKAATGTRAWAEFYGRGSYDQPYSLTVSPAANEVVVTGRSSLNPDYGYQWATVAYSAATGTRLWAEIYTAGDLPYMTAFSPTGTKVYVTGGAASDTEYATVAYNAGTGKPVWAKTYTLVSPYGSTDYATALAIGPGGTVFVTGSSEGDYTTIAYQG